MLKWITNRFPRKPAIQKTCENCNYYYTGHIDGRVNCMQCGKGHRLIADEDMKIEHRPYDDLDEKTIRVTESGWHDSGRKTGDVMLGRLDCPDWKRQEFRLDLGNPEYD